jgi:hypothetical protein
VADPRTARWVTMVLRVSALTSVAGSGLRQQCGEVRPGVDPLGQQVTVFVEEAFATETAAESLVEGLRFYVGGARRCAGSGPPWPGAGWRVAAATVARGRAVDDRGGVQGPHLTGGASRVVSGDGCGGDRDQ